MNVSWDSSGNLSVPRIKEEAWTFRMRKCFFLIHYTVRNPNPQPGGKLLPETYGATYDPLKNQTLRHRDLATYRGKPLLLHRMLAGKVSLHSKSIYKHVVHGMSCSRKYASLKTSPLLWLFLIMENNFVLGYEKYFSFCKSYFVRLPFIA